MAPPKNLSIAYHEVGHVVVAYIEGIEIKSVTIIPGDGYDGLFEINTKEKTTTNKDLIKSYIKMRLAGAIAQAFYMNNIKATYNNIGSAEDNLEAFNLIKGMCYSKEENNNEIQKLIGETHTIVFENWDIIEGLANELYKQKTLTGKRVVKILNEHTKGKE